MEKGDWVNIPNFGACKYSEDLYSISDTFVLSLHPQKAFDLLN